MGDGVKGDEGLYSRLPPAGRREGAAGPPRVGLFCHQHDDSVVPRRTIIYRGLPRAAWPVASRQVGLRTTCVLGHGGGLLLLSEALSLLNGIQQLLF